MSIFRICFILHSSFFTVNSIDIITAMKSSTKNASEVVRPDYRRVKKKPLTYIYLSMVCTVSFWPISLINDRPLDLWSVYIASMLNIELQCKLGDMLWDEINLGLY